MLKSGRPNSSKATTSPSITVFSGRSPRAVNYERELSVEGFSASCAIQCGLEEHLFGRGWKIVHVAEKCHQFPNLLLAQDVFPAGHGSPCISSGAEKPQPEILVEKSALSWWLTHFSERRVARKRLRREMASHNSDCRQIFRCRASCSGISRSSRILSALDHPAMNSPPPSWLHCDSGVPQLPCFPTWPGLHTAW
jgi:hypothetical protein